MGWGSGSMLMEDVIDALQLHVPNESSRHAVYCALIPAFEEMDCDTLCECLHMDTAFDKAYKELKPYEEE